MKRRIVTSLLCAVILIVSCVTAQASIFKNPFDLGEDGQFTVKTKTVKKPPATIKCELKLGPETKAGYIYSHYVLEGKKDGYGPNSDTVEGDGWYFTLTIDLDVKTDIARQNKDHYQNQILISSSYLTGKADNVTLDYKGEVEGSKLDASTSKDKRQKAVEKLQKYRGLSKEEIQKKAEDEKKEKDAKEAYAANFDIKGTGYFKPECQSATMFSFDDPGFRMFLDYTASDAMVGDINFNVALSVSEKGVAKAVLKFKNKAGQPFELELTGDFKCEKEKETDIKIKKSIPIWGTWTDGDVYAAVPRILKDHEKRRTQLAAREKDPSAKVDTVVYNNGKWLNLIKDKKITYPPNTQTALDPKTTPPSYELIVIEDNYILYEKGELWVQFGNSSVFRPAVRYKFPRDHQNNMDLYSQQLEKYEQQLFDTTVRMSYSFISDTLSTSSSIFIAHTMKRVKAGGFADTWSSVKGLEKPDPKTVRDKAGIWYEFKVTKGEYIDGTDENGNPVKVYVPAESGYTWERLTVNGNGTAEALSGTAIANAFDDALLCFIEKKITYDASGKAVTEIYGLTKDADGNEVPIEDFEFEKITVRHSDYNKDAGTIKLNGDEFYKVTKSALNGTWSTDKNAPPLPDTSKPDARAAIMANYEEIHWLKLDSAKREFTRVSWPVEDGILVEKGTYKTMGDSQIVLDDISGTFYEADGECIMENEPWQLQTATLLYYTKNDSEIYILELGEMYKAK